MVFWRPMLSLIGWVLNIGFSVLSNRWGTQTFSHTHTLLPYIPKSFPGWIRARPYNECPITATPPRWTKLLFALQKMVWALSCKPPTLLQTFTIHSSSLRIQQTNLTSIQTRPICYQLFAWTHLTVQGNIPKVQLLLV